MPSVAEFLIERIENAGLNHVFGVSGEYISHFFKKMQESQTLSIINTVDESGAAHAADAYARTAGIGCVAVDYNVGAFKVINAVACAFAERSPVIVISGAPPLKNKNRTFSCQKEMFKNITCEQVVLNDANEAGYEIDRMFEALSHHKQPVYIELPKDIAEKSISYDVYRQGTPESPKTDCENLEEAIQEVRNWICSAKKPVILAGVELVRFGVEGLMQKFAEKTNIPIVATLLSKSVISEKHPLYLGLYQGDYSQEGVQHAIDESDCLIMLGVLNGDIALKYLPTGLVKRNVISCTVDELRIKNHVYGNVQFKDFVTAVFKLDLSRKPICLESKVSVKQQFVPTSSKTTLKRVFQKIDSVLTQNMAVIADVGNSLFSAADLTVHSKSGFIGSALYSVKGYSIPASLGAGLACKDNRPVVILGDSAFQIASMEICSLIRNKVGAIIIVLNANSHDNNYHKICDVIGGDGYRTGTEAEFASALDMAVKKDRLCIIDVQLDKDDISPILKKMKGTF